MDQSSPIAQSREFTPPLGKAWLTPLYDTAIRLLTSEKRWRSALVTFANLQPQDRLIDVGSGTGSLLLDLHKTCSDANLLGVEPDLQALRIARRKASNIGASIRWHNGFLDDLETMDDKPPNKIVSSLVFHQVPAEQKARIIEQMWHLLETGGTVLIADYMQQEKPLMRRLFRATVQRLDGLADTQPNADGTMEQLISARFEASEKLTEFHTATGTISLWRGIKKETHI